MEMSNQQPEPEGCLAPGDAVDLWVHRVEQTSRSVSREKREPQTGPASCLSNSASKGIDASGEDVEKDEPNTKATAWGEVAEGLPGSKSVARAEGNTSNEGGLELSRRTNCASQAGMPMRRQGVLAKAVRGVGSARSRSPQGCRPEVTEGADNLTKSTQATSPVRLTEQDWQTFLWAIDDVSG